MDDYVLSLSYGKDSLACLGAIEQLGLPLTRIIHAEVWATDTIPADLPPMMEFKVKADRIIKERWGIEVEHLRSKYSYESFFYKGIGDRSVKLRQKRKEEFEKQGKIYNDGGLIYGFPMVRGAWCNDRLKIAALKMCKHTGVDYIGIAADEPNRIHRLTDRKRSPLVEADWTEAMCRKWCEENDLLSPIYTTATRGGCWFCHNQGVNQLRLLRKNYPKYWELLLKWDNDSPVSFHPDGHTVHDFDKRFQLEDEMLLDPNGTFRWNMLDGDLQMRLL